MHAYSFAGDRLRAFGLIAFLAVIFAITANTVSDKVGLGPPWLVSAPTVAAVFGILYGVVDKWAWRWPLLRVTGVINTPVVSGHYEGRLRSSYQNTELPITIDIEQTWTRLIVRLKVLSPQSSDSISLAAALRDVGQHRAQLTYVYRNTVRPGFAEPDMNDHDGTAELTIDAVDHTATGRYYNYRGRQGTLELTQS